MASITPRRRLDSEAKVREPVIWMPGGDAAGSPREGLGVAGRSFAIHEWRDSGPRSLHVHHDDDEAWHVLEGTLRFRFADRTVEVGAGGTVFVPAGVPHTYEAIDARYLLVIPPRIEALIRELRRGPEKGDLPRIYRAYASEILE